MIIHKYIPDSPERKSPEDERSGAGVRIKKAGNSQPQTERKTKNGGRGLQFLKLGAINAGVM